MSVTSSADVITRLIDEKVDIGFGFVAKTPRQIEMAIRRDVPIGVLMRPDHPLASAPLLTLSDWVRYPLAIAKPEISIRELIEPFLQQSELSLSPPIEVDSIRMLVELAQFGHYASIMTPIGAQGEIASGALIFRALQDPGLPTNRFALLIRTGAAGLHFAPAVFYEHAKHYFGTVELPGVI